MSEHSDKTIGSIDDIVNLSDDEIMSMSAPVWDDNTEEDNHEEVEDTDVELTNESSEEDEYEIEDTELEDEMESDSEEEYEEYEDDEEDTSTESDKEDESDDEDYESEDEEDTLEEDSEDDSTDEEVKYKAMYEELMAPFKANKKEIKVDTPEELRRLAQMGVGYNAKMAEIKPLRKIGKMLEKAGLLDENKINYLIDLTNNDQGAINKLIKDSGIDPLDLDTEETDYKPNTYNVNDGELDLSDTLKALEQTDSGRKVIDEVDSKWDEASKEVLVHNPTMFNTLSEHVSDGTYDKIMNIIAKERALNNVPQGVTDLQAYTHIGQHLANEAAANEKKKQEEEVVRTTKPKVIKKKSVTKRNKLRQAAATSRGKTTKKTNMDNVDFINMSDAEFEKKYS